MDMSECPTSTPDRHPASFQEAGHQNMHATAAKDSLFGMDMLSQKGTLLLDTVQITAAATTLGCYGSTGPSHRKWMMDLSHPHNIHSRRVLSSLGAVGTIGV